MTMKGIPFTKLKKSGRESGKNATVRGHCLLATYGAKS